MLAYAIYDVQENKQHMFSTAGTVLAKDAVMAFFEKNKSEFFTDSQEENFKTMLTSISGASSIEELSEALVGWDFSFGMLKVD